MLHHLLIHTIEKRERRERAVEERWRRGRRRRQRKKEREKKEEVGKVEEREDGIKGGSYGSKEGSRYLGTPKKNVGCTSRNVSPRVPCEEKSTALR